MSADAWRICPQCKAREVLKHKKPTAAEIYGKVSVDEYERMKLEELQIVEEDVEETLREDYEIYMREDGMLDISYSCSCSVCGFSVEFESKKQHPISLEKNK